MSNKVHNSPLSSFDSDLKSLARYLKFGQIVVPKLERDALMQIWFKIASRKHSEMASG